MPHVSSQSIADNNTIDHFRAIFNQPRPDRPSDKYIFPKTIRRDPNDRESSIAPGKRYPRWTLFERLMISAAVSVLLDLNDHFPRPDEVQALIDAHFSGFDRNMRAVKVAISSNAEVEVKDQARKRAARAARRASANEERLASGSNYSHSSGACYVEDEEDADGIDSQPLQEALALKSLAQHDVICADIRGLQESLEEKISEAVEQNLRPGLSQEEADELREQIAILQAENAAYRDAHEREQSKKSQLCEIVCDSFTAFQQFQASLQSSLMANAEGTRLARAHMLQRIQSGTGGERAGHDQRGLLSLPRPQVSDEEEEGGVTPEDSKSGGGQQGEELGSKRPRLE